MIKLIFPMTFVWKNYCHRQAGYWHSLNISVLRKHAPMICNIPGVTYIKTMEKVPREYISIFQQQHQLHLPCSLMLTYGLRTEYA